MNLKQLTTATLLLIGTFGAVSNLCAADDTLPPPPHAGEHGPGPGGPGGKRMNAEERVKQLTEALSLTEAQATKITAIIKAEGKELHDLAPEQRKEQGKAIREATKTKIRAELTPEQITKLDAWEKSHPAGGPRGEHGGHGDKKGGEKQ